MSMISKLALVVLVAALAQTARADAPAGAAEARQHADEAAKHFNLGEFDAAASEYRAAYKAMPDPVLLYNIAQSYRQARDYRQALFFYRSYRHNLPDAPNRAEVEGRIDELEKLQPRSGAAPAPQGTTTTTSPSGAASTGAAPVAPSVSAPAPRRNSHRRAWIWVGTITGVALVGAAVGVGVWAATRPPDFSTTLPGFSHSALTLRF